MISPPLSLYAHLPWCVKKCPYCDFNSYSGGDARQKARYISALITDLQQEARRIHARQVETIFLGGGTPSLFSPEEIGRVLEGIFESFDVAENVEITMEANPGTVECGAPAGYRAAGVNRLSIGAQSFVDKSLRALGRIHDSADIRCAVSAAQQAGFDNINIDLMYALPEQDVAAALADIDAVIELRPQHVSWYQLTLEPNTIFFARPPAGLPDNDLAFEIQERGRAHLEASGYAQYEVSAYATEGRQCRHNLNYWRFGDYVAVGAGAHGKLSNDGKVRRYQKPANPGQYMQAIERNERVGVASALTPPDLIFEFMLNGLRLSDGFSQQLFCERTGLDAAQLVVASENARARGLLECTANDVWRPTPRGGRFLNDLQAEFLHQPP